MKHHNTIRLLRRQYDLTQEEFADLLGVHQTTASRMEHGDITPEFELALGTYAVFGIRLNDIFPTLYAAVEEAVMARAAALDTLLREKPGFATSNKLRLLKGMVRRAGHNSTGL